MAGLGSARSLLRYLHVSAAVICAAGTLVITGAVNAHSVAWLTGLYFTLGLLIAALRQRRESALNWSYALYLGVLLQYFLIVWFLHVTLPFPNYASTQSYVNRMAQILCFGSVVMPVTLYHFTLRFADNKWKVLKVIEYLGWAGAAGFYLSNLCGRYYSTHRWAGYTWVPEIGGTYRYFFYFTTFFVTLGIIVPLISIPATRSRQRRLQLGYFLLGGVPLWLCCWGNFLISFGINIYPAGGVMFLIHAAIMAYAVFKKRVFDFTLVIRRGLAYALASILMGLLYGLIVWTLAQQAAEFHTTLISSVLFVVAIGLLFAPLNGYLQHYVDRLFFREMAAKQETLEKFAKESATTIDLNLLAKYLCTVIAQSLSPRNVLLYLESPKHEYVLFSSYANGQLRLETRPEGSVLSAEWARERSVLRIPSRERRTFLNPIEITEEGDSLLVPVSHHSHILGYLVLEPKLADETYADDDIHLAEAIAAQIATALQNARSFATLEKMETFTRNMLEGLSVAVVVVGSSGEILRFNSAATEILGIQVASTLNDFARLHPEIAHVFQEVLSAENSFENREIVTLEEKPRYLLVSACCLGKDDWQTLHQVSLTDITAFREIERAAMQRESLAKLGEAISTINHEIKNVLQPVRYQMNALQQRDASEADLRAAAAIIPERLIALDRLLQNLRELARPIEIRLSEVDLEDMLHYVWRDVAELPEAKQVAFEVTSLEPNTPLQVDGHLFQRILYNLLRNGVEACQGRPRASIRAEIKRTDEQTEIKLIDTGCGIDAMALNKLFNLFYSTKGEAGTGLGLSICRKLIELHDGTIAVTSTVDVGTCVTISLPQRQTVQSASVDR